MAALWAPFLLALVVSAETARLPFRVNDPVGATELTIAPGSPILHVVLFATWCPPCVEELERLALLEARWEERGYRLVLVAVSHRHSRARLVEFVESRRPPGTLVHDASGRAQAMLQAEHLPTHILFDRAGREIERASSLTPEIERAMKQVLMDQSRGGVERD